MLGIFKLGLFLASVFNPIVAEFQNPYPPVAALFGPKNQFLCNAVVLGQGRVLTPADCLFLQSNKTCYHLGKPEQFHVALETHSIERFQNGKAFGKGSKWKYLNKLNQKFGKKYDNKYSNEVFSGKMKAEEKKYLMKALRPVGVDVNMKSHYVKVIKFIIHPKFKGPFNNDLAVLNIPEAYPAANSSIVDVTNVDIETLYNVSLQVYGFGVLSHGVNETNRTAFFKVRTVEMFLIPPDLCQRDLDDLFIPDQHMCLLPKSNETLCFGFTGAPIVFNGKLIGIVDFGHYSCSLESPIVGIRLDAFRDFLGLEHSGLLGRFSVTVRNLIAHLLGIFFRMG